MISPKACRFCKEGKDPDYKEVNVLHGFTSEHGRIFSQNRTGVCAKHQRRLTIAIKRARHLALLPFIARVS